MAARKRLRLLQQGQNAGRFVIDDMVAEVLERLAFVRHSPARSLVIGDWTRQLAEALDGEVVEADIIAFDKHSALDLEKPFPQGGFDLIVCLGVLDTVNDLPGALIHIRNALAPGGLAINSFTGGGSLPVLRRVMIAADGDKPAGRVHPMVDVRAGAQLIQRAGLSDPVVDSHALSVRYGSLQRLVQDLREQGVSSALASHTPFPGKQGWKRAEVAFANEADADGRVTETFEIVTLTGRRR